MTNFNDRPVEGGVMAMTCAYRDVDGHWRRSLLHVWKKRTYSKTCARCGTTKAR